MNARLFLKLVDAMRSVINSKEREADSSFYVGNNTAELMAKAAAAVYDGMTYASSLEESKGEDK